MGERNGPSYRLTPQEIERFHADGWVHLAGVVAEEELCELERIYQRFLAREIPVEGRDFCDMSADFGKPIEEFAIVNVMLPRRYFPPLAGNVYERRAASISAQLCGVDMALDYDQFVAKSPHQPGALFHWHQDLAYWPVTPDTRTASFWLALDETTRANGCLSFVTGSHREGRLRPHEPLFGDRDKSHTLVASVDPARDRIVAAELRRGDCTVHHERALHGSLGNTTAGWRRGYVVAFRSEATVREERARGFTHSHNDAQAVLARVGRESEA